MGLMDLVRLVRPAQWVKNGFVLFPVIFSGRVTDWRALAASAAALAAFCLAASAIYCVNDVVDREADRQHPRKRLRPVASGRVSVAAAAAVACVLMAAAVALPALALGAWAASWVIAAYLVLNLTYCFKLKRIALVDVSIIAVGFVLRVICGAVASGIPASHWIIIMTFLLSLFLALAKRRDDVVIYEETGKSMRANINRYNLPFLNMTISLVSAITVMSYIMYTVSPEVSGRIGSEWLYVTSLFVLLGMIRYLQITIVDVASGSPTKVILTDRFLQLCVAGWIVTFFLILYV